MSDHLFCRRCSNPQLLSTYERVTGLCARCRTCENGGCGRRPLPESKFCPRCHKRKAAQKAQARGQTHIKQREQKQRRRPKRKKPGVTTAGTRTLADNQSKRQRKRQNRNQPKPRIKQNPNQPTKRGTPQTRIKPPAAKPKPKKLCEQCGVPSTFYRWVNRDGTGVRDRLHLCDECHELWKRIHLHDPPPTPTETTKTIVTLYPCVSCGEAGSVAVWLDGKHRKWLCAACDVQLQLLRSSTETNV